MLLNVSWDYSGFGISRLFPYKYIVEIKPETLCIESRYKFIWLILIVQHLLS